MSQDSAQKETQKETQKDPFAGFITSGNGPDFKEKESAPNASDDETPDASDDESAKKKKSRSVEERIAKITKARREAEREAAARDAENAELRKRLADLEKKTGLTEPAKRANSDPDAPDPTDASKYPYGEVDPQYIGDLADYRADKKIAAFRAEQEQLRQEEAAGRQAQELQQRADKVLVDGVTKYDDFEDVVLNNPDLNIEGEVSGEVREMILGSDNAADILYHIGQNPREAAEMVSKSPTEQARYIGKLEAKFSAGSAAATTQKPKSAPKAPAPPNTKVRGSDGRFAVSDDTDDFAAFKSKYEIKAS